jgi:hypothetical protein
MHVTELQTISSESVAVPWCCGVVSAGYTMARLMCTSAVCVCRNKTNCAAFSLQANYTDRAAVACRRSQRQFWWVVCVALSAQQIHT